MLDAFGLINMNGRMYDPVLGRMLSPDNYVSLPEHTQGYNRYTYALNNPLIITDPSGDNPVLLFIAFAGVLNGAMSAQNGDGFLQGFAIGTATAALSYGVGTAVGPVVSGGKIWADMANAGIHTAITGGITYGADALVNNAAFNWKGYGLNIATSMAMAGLSYQKQGTQLPKYTRADLEAAGLQSELGGGYGMSGGGGGPKNTRTYNQRHNYNREEPFRANTSYSRGVVGGRKYALLGFQLGIVGGIKYSKSTLSFSLSRPTHSFETFSSFGFGVGFYGMYGEYNHDTRKINGEISIGPLVISNSDNPFVLRVASGNIGAYAVIDGALDINLSGTGPDTKYVTPLMPADNTYYYTNPYNQWRMIIK
jgi:RHS repeat-associated protein